MVDLIFGVDDVKQWHSDNIARNRSHYSALSWFGSTAVAAVNQRGPAGVYFNTDITLADGLVSVLSCYLCLRLRFVNNSV
jgi:hypothetical protein